MTWYAHPMGWWRAVFGGVVYGTVVSGLTYITWRAITFSDPLSRYWLIFLFLWVMPFSVVLLMEREELDKVKRGALDIRLTKRSRV